MSSMTIKDVPESLLDLIRGEAARQHRSMNKTFIHLVERGLHQGLAGRPFDPAQTEQQVANWSQLAGQWDSGQSAAEEVDELYARRTPGREVNL